MNYQQLLESLGAKLAELTHEREHAFRKLILARSDSERMRMMCEVERAAQKEITELNSSLAELGGAIAAVARAANNDLRQL
jgi:hypothetical protein